MDAPRTGVTVAALPCETGDWLVLTGRLDRRCTADARLALLGAIESGTGPLQVDLAGCEIADATAMGLLVECFRRSHRAGRSLHIVAADLRTHRLLRRARLSRLLHPDQASSPAVAPA